MKPGSFVDPEPQYQEIEIVDMEDDVNQFNQTVTEYSYKDVDPQDIKVEYFDTPSPAKSPLKVDSPAKPSTQKKKKSKAERELLKRKLKYFKMVCNKQFGSIVAAPIEMTNDTEQQEG